MNNDSLAANVGSNDGLGVLVERLRACLPLASDGPDHKTWCSVLGSDLREAVKQLTALRSKSINCTEPNRRACPRLCVEFCNRQESGF